MYLEKRYSLELYARILRNFERIFSGMSSEEKRKLLFDLGVKKIRTGIRKSREVSVMSRKDLPINADRALAKTIDEIDRYLREYREEFVSDFESGKLEGLVGRQREFEFFGDAMPPRLLDGGLSIGERISYFARH